MLVSPRKNGLTSLNKEVRVFKVSQQRRPSGNSYLFHGKFIHSTKDYASNNFIANGRSQAPPVPANEP